MGAVDKPAESRTDGRLSEKALVLTAGSFVLLTPPILTIFDVPLTVFGIPLLYLYCFAVWLAAIVLGGRLARRMEPHPAPGERSPAAPRNEG
jgi:hypothetical protein